MKYSKRLLLPLRLFIFSLYLSLQAMAQPDSALVKKYIAEFPDFYGISRAEVAAILSKAQFQASIIEKMEKPAEGTMTWEKYRNIFMREERIQAGVDFWKNNGSTIRAVSQKSGVDESVIIGILGVETFFGQRAGSYRVLDALYTLAFGFPKRAKYFTSELTEYIVLCQKEKLDIYGIKGSYAGAMGYCQFMPSSYRAYAVSYQDGGNRDLINDVDDAIASVANYLQMHRWKRDAPVATSALTGDRTVTLPAQSIKPRYKLAYYINQGYEPATPMDEQTMTSLLTFDMEDGSKEYWITTDNFYAITRYNHSPLYALAVWQLGQEVERRKNNP